MSSPQPDVPERQAIPPPLGKPWSPGATLALAIPIAGVWVAAQIAVALAFLAVLGLRHPGVPTMDLAAGLETDGLHFALAVLASAALTIPLVLLLAALRRGMSLSQYLRLDRFRLRDLVLWVLVFAAFVAVSEWIIRWAGQDSAEIYIAEIYRSARFTPLLWLAVVLAAPIAEELFFRGFLFEGLRRSWLGTAGTVLFTSATWSLIHLQYDLFFIALIFCLGLLLGWARAASGSLWIPLILHVLNNLYSLSLTALQG
ncbi:MAG TPA: CPBP family intramembrane glutamic endopeptidase [Verrucomicrobiales bacterium]|nr:CPBP family intramembrane glutamic endopeptidase [Verrucomicrobiales bacterium]